MAQRRGPREVPFSLDCFVDVITNLVGIVLRLMLVVMMGALLTERYVPPAAASGAAAESEPSALDPEMQAYEADIAALQSRLLELMRFGDDSENEAQQLAAETDRLHAELAKQASVQKEVLAGAAKQTVARDHAIAEVAAVEQDVSKLRDRLKALAEATKELENRPRAKKALRFHVPVSRPVGANQLMFEFRSGRVTFADLQALMDQVKEAMPRAVDQLHTQWEVRDTVGPVGAFRLQYVVARERSSPLENTPGGGPATTGRGFSYGMVGWELVPVWTERGETVDEALAPGSRFRQVIDGMDPNQVALTFFVYSDSFPAFRRVRDYLYDNGFVVAGRPLPMDAPIAGSRTGTISRGQ